MYMKERGGWKTRMIAEGKYKPWNPADIDKERAIEMGKCYANPAYFIDNYCKIYDSVSSSWIPFTLWDSQKELLSAVHYKQLLVILKARQLGISWLSLSYALWQIMFRPIASVSVFSRREPEAIYLLGPERLRGIYHNLPEWMKTGIKTTVDNGKEWILSTGSVARAFPTSAGDGYVSTLAIVDEADLTPDLNQLMRSVKPTIEMGGKLILLSRVNKSEPESEFKSIYRGAKSGENGWYPVFLPWHSHPNRDKDWYERQRKDIQSRTGSLDDLYEQYPATDTQALSARTLDKRIPPHWVELCYEELKPIRDNKSPALPNFIIYKKPEDGVRYVLGADPAEGNPTSDDSSLSVIDQVNGEEIALLSGKYEPAIFASYIMQISNYYNHAPVMVERNNHGHSVIQWLEEHARRVRLLPGHDAEAHKAGKKARTARKRKKAGWLSSTLGKTILYTITAEFFRANADLDGASPKKVLHNFATQVQLTSIEAATLRAPEGQYDDRADAYALAQAGRAQIISAGQGGILIVDSVQGWGF
jgi:hypothetical protein